MVALQIYDRVMYENKYVVDRVKWLEEVGHLNRRAAYYPTTSDPFSTDRLERLP